MSAYESLAACYDELTYDIPYEKTLTFFERLCAREHVQPHSVLDLACGTGSLTRLCWSLRMRRRQCRRP